MGVWEGLYCEFELLYTCQIGGLYAMVLLKERVKKLCINCTKREKNRMNLIIPAAMVLIFILYFETEY